MHLVATLRQEQCSPFTVPLSLLTCVHSYVISLPSHPSSTPPSLAMTVLQTSETSLFIDSSRSTTSDIHQSLLTQLTSLRDNASAAVGTVNETGINFAIARAILVSTNSTLTSKPLQLPDYKTSFTGFYLQLPSRSWRQEGHTFKWRRERGRETRES